MKNPGWDFLACLWRSHGVCGIRTDGVPRIRPDRCFECQLALSRTRYFRAYLRTLTTKLVGVLVKADELSMIYILNSANTVSKEV